MKNFKFWRFDGTFEYQYFTDKDEYRMIGFGINFRVNPNSPDLLSYIWELDIMLRLWKYDFRFFLGFKRRGKIKKSEEKS